MTDNLVSPTVFKWFVSILTAGITGTWFVWDILKLWWLRRADRSDPIVRDKQFGYSLGVVICAIGLIGVLMFHGVL